MGNISNKNNMLAIQYNNAINDKFVNICSPLFDNFSITHFFYIKVFENGSRLYLCNDKKWVEHYVDHKFQDDSLHMKSYMPNAMQHSLWSGFHKDKVYSAVYDFNVWNGFNIYEQQKDESVVIYAFGSTRSNEAITNFYINNLSILKNFILHFKDKALDMLDSSDESKLIASNIKPQVFSLEQNDVKKFYEQINPQKFLFRGKLTDIHLTKGEAKCLYQLTMGKTAKEIGRYLGISHRTIESYLGKIKKKTGFQTRSELIRGFCETPGFNFYETLKI